MGVLVCIALLGTSYISTEIIRNGGNTLKLILLIICLFVALFSSIGLTREYNNLSFSILMTFFWFGLIYSTIIGWFISFEGYNRWGTRLIFAALLLYVLSSILWYNSKVNSDSPTLMNLEFYDEAGLYIDIREDNTFLARNDVFLSTKYVVGSYEMTDSTIVLSDHVMFRSDTIAKTLKSTDDRNYSFYRKSDIDGKPKGILKPKR